MPVLSVQEDEDFAQAVAFGFTPYQAADELGYSVNKIQALQMANRPDIKERVQELVQSQLFDTTNEHIRVAQQLEMDREFAYELGNPAAAINASVQRAKVLGIYIEKSEQHNQVAVTSNKELTDKEWESQYGEKNGK